MYFFLRSLFEPYFLLLVLLGGVLLGLARRIRPGWKRGLLLWSPYVLLVLLSSPAAAYWIAGSLERSYPPLTRCPEDVEAIVILAAGWWDHGDSTGQPTLNSASRARTELGAVYHRQRPLLPLVVSGGILPPETTNIALAECMRDHLVALGVPPERILLEGDSQTTWENAVACAALLRARGLQRIVLVTSATHLHRAVGCFRKQGLSVVAAGVDYQATTWNCTWKGVQPNPETLYLVQGALHEWGGLVWYALCGRV